jgi:hypothetical protein
MTTPFRNTRPPRAILSLATSLAVSGCADSPAAPVDRSTAAVPPSAAMAADALPRASLSIVSTHSLPITEVTALRGGDAPTFTRPSYDYSPSFMKDTDGKYKLWWCGAPDRTTTSPGDHVIYSEAGSPGGPWTAPRIVFTPTGNRTRFDGIHICDPSVVKVRGTYYMYYTGSNDADLGGIGVATSVDGTNWTPLNGGNPIITRYAAGSTYGAGQPSVVFLDDWYYMLYYDSSGRAGPGGYVLRSRSPLFPLNAAQTQELANSGGRVAFWPYDVSRRATHRVYPIEIVNADLTYNRSLQKFVVSVNGDDNPKRLAQLFYSKDLTTVLAEVRWAGGWTEGPGALRGPDGRSVPYPDANALNYYQHCVVPIDVFRSVGPGGPITWDLAYTGANVHVNVTCPAGEVLSDYDRDGWSDRALFRSGQFYVKRSNSRVEMLQSAVIGNGSLSTPVRGDFDGDNVADLAVINTSNGALYWTIQYSGGGSRYQPTWGYASDRIAVADYNGDGKDDIAVFRDGVFWIIYDNGTTRALNWGLAGDIPVGADYEGDGIDDLAVYRPSNGTWYIRFSSSGGTGAFQFGLPGDVPVPDDYFSDGSSALAVWRPGNGTWYMQSIRKGVTSTIQWGLPGDVPTVGDFDGDGVADLTVWRPSNGTWYHNHRDGRTTVIPHGLPTDLIPVNRCVGRNAC